MIRAVLDTNVIVSATLKANGSPGLVLAAARRGDFVIVTSAPLLRELRDVLARPKISARLGWSPAAQTEFMAAFAASALLVDPQRALTVVLADPTDDRLIEAAVEAEAGFLVSGDSHLLVIEQYERTRIVTPARFLLALAAEGTGSGVA